MLKSLGNSREIPQSFNFVRPEMKKGKKNGSNFSKQSLNSPRKMHLKCDGPNP